jgi:putative copper resistance protein D
MTFPTDLVAFLTTLLRGGQLAGQALLIGGGAFLLGLAQPLAPRFGAAGVALMAASRRWLRRSALLLAFVATANAGLSMVDLHAALGLPYSQAAGADFVRWAAVIVIAAAIAALLLAVPGRQPAGLPLVLTGAAALVGSVMSSHAAARIDHRSFFMAADLLHQLGASVWIGGIPFLLLGLHHVRTADCRLLVGLRFSHMAMVAVVCLAIGAILMAAGYTRSVTAAVGTAYGAMMGAKLALLGVLLLLAFFNMLSARGSAADPTLGRLSNFAEVEIGIGMALMFIAASLATQPPAVDQALDPTSVATLSEIVGRLAPHWPRWSSPPHEMVTIPTEGALAPINTEIDRAWSEFNHHWAGVFVLAIGLLALAERSGAAPWARHWPLAFLGLGAMLFVRSDPENWPLGPIPFFKGFSDPEVTQHRLVVLLLIPFACFEWAVRTGRLTKPWARAVFPLLCALGGTLLLTHNHTLTDAKQRYLIELTHIPMGILGILAGWARWLEIRSKGPVIRAASWVWPVCFALIGLLLIDYRES